MPYKHRPDGRIAVTIDSNVWDQLFRFGLNLTAELPVERFALFIPREIEIELAAIPDSPEKLALKEYIRRQIRDAKVKVSANLGFATNSGLQRRGGLGCGTFQSEDSRAFYGVIQKPYLVGRSRRGSQLGHNEGDAAVGASSLASVVLTQDVRKAGPIRVAIEHGGKILDMTNFAPSGPALATLVEKCHRAV